MTTPCSECIKGTIHPGLPKGTITPLYGLNTYITGNQTNPQATIIIYSDIFGHSLPNNLLLADALAASGKYLVYLPDFFKGDPVSLSVADALLPVDAAAQSTFAKYTGILASLPAFLLWMTRHRAVNEERICNEFLGKVRRGAKPGHRVGMVGYCWGGKYAVRAGLERNMIDTPEGGEKKPLVDAVVALHPSHLVVPDDVGELVVPVSFGWGVEDVAVSFKQKGEVERCREGREGPEMQHRVYRPGRHGFAVRGNPDDPEERKCLEDSERQVLEWFDKWL